MSEEEVYSPLIKICGLSRKEDIEIVNEVGVDYAGFVINYPDSHRNVSPAKAYELASGLDKSIRSVGVFVNQPFDLVAEMLNYGAIDVAQLHGDEDESYIDVLKAMAPEGEIWKCCKIKPELANDKALEILRESERSLADVVLLDSGYGAGLTFDHSLIGRYKRPFFIAGGINAHNVSAVVAELRPYGIDVSSGVETDNMKDPDKIKEFVRLARGAFC